MPERRCARDHRTCHALRLPVLVAMIGGILACQDQESRPTSPAAADSADQVIFGLAHQMAVDGVLRARLKADTARFYQGSQLAQLVRITVTFYSPQGAETSTLTGDSGTYEWRTGNMEARGNVVAVTPDGRRLTTSVLRYRRDIQQIDGPAPFVFDSRERHLEGESFTSDPDFKNVVTTKPRRGTVGRVER